MAIGLAVTLLGGSSVAGADCVVRVQNGPPRWREAARIAEESVQAGLNDCDAIDVRVDGQGAFVELHTTDGRDAVRRIGSPMELGPVVRALLTSTPMPREEPALAAPAVAMPPPAEPSVEPAVDRAPAAPPRARTTELFAGIATGLKFQEQDDPAPLGKIHAGVSFHDWQLGAFGRWEFEHRVDGQPKHSSRSAFGGGLTFGRRQGVGPTSVVFGAQMGLFSVEGEARTDRSGRARVEDSVLDPRAGLYVGIVMPAIRSFRTRVQLDSEVAVIHRDDLAAFPNVPDWGLALTLGVDFGGSP